MCFKAKKTKEEVEQEAKNQEIEKLLKQDRAIEEKNIKILILGTGDSGKTTFTKQLTCLHGTLSKETLESYSFILKDLALRGAQTLINCAEETGILPADLGEPARRIMDSQVLTPAVAKDIIMVTVHEEMQKLLEAKGEGLQMQGGVSGVKYYWKNAERYAEDSFVPNNEDYFKARIKTTGIVESTFTVNNTNFTIVDVGGQRSERKKWLHCFGSVDAIIFLAAINEYDMVLEEDETENRLVESIKLWRALTNAPFFKGIPFILFLNKSDLFEQKLPKVPLAEIFADYPTFHESSAVAGLSDYEKGWKFIKEQYAKYFAGTSFYAHTTCAIDTESCRKVFKSVQDQMFREAFDDKAL
eukprot:TRINITY_DN3107_c0_g1_i22.p1 TRINITY_DN3107_c0_g1~~TRINITY_DN3107_c0_g1_i22.p1  ORF type:complete len:357 (+),score=57.80 TRINITY_DN3107_c0_g1_i22:82-1152(+)